MEFNLLLDKKNSFNFMEWTFSFRILQEEGKNWNIAINVILDQLAESNLQSWLNLEVVHRILLEPSCEMYHGIFKEEE